MSQASTNRHNAQRRIMVLQRWKDGSVILNCDFEGTHISPEDVSAAIASGKYTTDQIFEVYECWPRSSCRDITDDVYAEAETLSGDPEGDLQQVGMDAERDRLAMEAA